MDMFYKVPSIILLNDWDRASLCGSLIWGSKALCGLKSLSPIFLGRCFYGFMRASCLLTGLMPYLQGFLGHRQLLVFVLLRLLYGAYEEGVRVLALRPVLWGCLVKRLPVKASYCCGLDTGLKRMQRFFRSRCSILYALCSMAIARWSWVSVICGGIEQQDIASLLAV